MQPIEKAVAEVAEVANYIKKIKYFAVVVIFCFFVTAYIIPSG